MTKEIYKTFEQWMNGNFLEVKEPRKKAYSKDELLLVEMGWKYGYDAGRAVEQALDKKAENARELGLDYEPALYTTPPAAPVQDVSLIDEGKTAAQPAVPDAITDNSESPEYRDGWNDCREFMLGRGK